MQERIRRWLAEFDHDVDHEEVALESILALGMDALESAHVHEARQLFQVVANSGHSDLGPKAMYELGVLEWKLGDASKASLWLHAAVDSHHSEWAPYGALNLARRAQLSGM